MYLGQYSSSTVNEKQKQVKKSAHAEEYAMNAIVTPAVHSVPLLAHEEDGNISPHYAPFKMNKVPEADKYEDAIELVDLDANVQSPCGSSFEPNLNKASETENTFKQSTERASSPAVVAEVGNATHSDNECQSPHQDLIIQRLKEFASSCNNMTTAQLRHEFGTLPTPNLTACKAGLDPQNARKNRYKNIPCLDSTRVLLTFLSQEDHTKYIHANRIDYPTLKNGFIITQGPLFATVKDFWRMVWQENVYYVVMLCRVLEEGKRRSAECFEPTIEHSTLYGPIKVTLKKTKWEGPIKFSQLELEYLHESRQINHYQWQDWVDSTAPTSGTLVELLKKVRGKSTVVVHCSAGIGRSGTFVAVEMCLQDLANALPIDVYKVVSALRRCRALAVQSFEQYLAIYRAILNIGEKHGAITRSEVAHFDEIYQSECEH
ncbi:hypothetical protein Q1695_008862 [Nippostrongylus brasiliensis]|nr:hypothetical protein Q1695_008862 [Nippostrongylus brasiliensis]